MSKYVPMTKTLFIQKLRQFVACEGRGMPDEYGHQDYRPSRCEVEEAAAFADWLSDDAIPDKELGLNWLHDLPKYLVEAFRDFRTQDRFAGLRDFHEKEIQRPIPDLLDISCDGIGRALTAMSMQRLMMLLAKDEDWLRERLHAFLNAQSYAVDQAWHNFVMTCYRPLAKRIKDERHRGNSGTFGKTKLYSYAIMGRIVFTFCRGPDKDMNSVTYVADDSDMFGLRAGMQSCHVPFTEAIEMINEVVSNFDNDKFVETSSVRIAGM